MHRRVYRALKQKPALIKKVARLQSVNGGLLKIDGFVTLSCKIGNTECTHGFYVSPSINRNFILGRDWLVQNGVRLFFDLGILKFNDTTVPLEEDIHIASLVRLGSKTVLKPQSATVCTGRIKDSGEIPSGELYAVSAIEKGFMGNQPGLMVSNSIAKMSKNRRLPILEVNNTNQTVSLSKGCVIAKVDSIASKRTESVNNLVKNTKPGDGKVWDADVDVTSH